MAGQWGISVNANLNLSQHQGVHENIFRRNTLARKSNFLSLRQGLCQHSANRKQHAAALISQLGILPSCRSSAWGCLQNSLKDILPGASVRLFKYPKGWMCVYDGKRQKKHRWKEKKKQETAPGYWLNCDH